MMLIPFPSYIPFSLSCMGISVGLIVIFAQAWNYTDFSPFIFIGNLILYSMGVAIAVLVFAVICKIIVWVIGWIIAKLGTPEKIVLERYNNNDFVEIKITNNENEQFTGELKVLQINDDKLVTPLSMGIFRSKINIEGTIVVPKGESVGVAIGLFDKVLGCAYFADIYNKQILLYPKTRIYTKLSGYLESGDEIIKASSWYIDYKIDSAGEKFSLSNLVELTVNFGFKTKTKFDLKKFFAR